MGVWGRRSSYIQDVLSGLTLAETLELAVSAFAMAATYGDDPPSDYYDILMLGRTGQGKSTTANKLLQVNNPDSVLVYRDGDGDSGAAGKAAVPVFEMGDGMDSVTSECKLISNEMSMIRVLDTPGFADTRETREHGVFRSNLRTFRSILRAQDANDLAFCRVLYFLPLRGPLERADGVLQEEIKLIHGYLGEEVFKIMVIIATNRKKKNGKQEDFDEDDLERTEKTFMKALEIIIGPKVIDRCPPILYLPFLEKNVIHRVVGAPVLYEEPLKQPVVVDFSQSSLKIEELVRREKLKHKGRKLQFRDRCVRCSSKLIYENTKHRGRVPVRIVIDEGGETEETIPYSDSKCHPYLLPKHSEVTKFLGGVAHLATFGVFVGIGKIRGKKLWPGFTNHDEFCAGCKGPPTAGGCMKVGKEFILTTEEGEEKIKTCHSTTLDKVHLIETTV